jgi:hypothetical protein
MRSWSLRNDSPSMERTLPGPSKRARVPMNEKNGRMAHRRMRGILRNHWRNNNSPPTARRVLSAFQYSARLVFSSGAKMCVRESRMPPRSSEIASGDVWCFTSASCAVGEISESSACLLRLSSERLSAADECAEEDRKIRVRTSDRQRPVQS